MSEEIDLRVYFAALWRNWYWLVGSAVVAGAVAFGISSILPPSYEATTLVVVSEPRERVQFDPRFQTLVEEQPVRAYPELATSDALLASLLSGLPSGFEDVTSLDDLRGLVNAAQGSDPTLLRLTFTSGDASAAADAANLWAETFVAYANDIYGDQGGGQLTYFQEQLGQAASDLSAAEEALIEFESRNRQAIIDGRLEALKESQNSFLERQQKIAEQSGDVQNLRDLVASREATAGPTAADQITALALQLQAFNASLQTPLELQIQAGETLAFSSRAEALSFLDDLLRTLEQGDEQIETQLAAMEPEMLALQEQSQVLASEQLRRQRDVTLAEETYTSVARKVDEERITSGDTSAGVRLASEAAVPRRPASPRKLVNTIVLAAMGFLGAVFVLFASEWWRSPAPEPAATAAGD